jgi:DNA repair exonuclease SbcCD nuclease subunit
MKVGLICDTHFGGRNDSLAFNEYFYKFWENTFFPYIEENGITHIIHLGDCFDRRKYINFRTLSDFRNRFMKRVEELGIEIHFIIGNHDAYYKNTNRVNTIREIFKKDTDKIKIHDEPTVVSFDGTEIMFIPWINSENRARTNKMIEETSAKIAMGHLEIKGFGMYANMKADHGDEASDFSKFERVFTGHYHHRNCDGNIMYLGSTYEITWSDYNDDRGFHIFDTDTWELEYIKNPYKMFQKIYYDDSEGDVNLDDQIAQCEGSYVKVIVENKSDYFMFDNFIDKLNSVNPIDVNIVEDLSFTADEKQFIDEAEDTMTILKNHVDSLEIEEEMKSPLKKLLSNLHTEALDIQ